MSVYTVSSGSFPACLHGSVCMSKISGLCFQWLVFCRGAVSGTSCWMPWLGVTPSKPLVSSLLKLTGKPVQFFCCLFLTQALVDVKSGQCSAYCHIDVRKTEFRKVHSWRSMWCLSHFIFYHTILYTCFCSEVDRVDLTELPTHQIAWQLFCFTFL